MPKRMRPIAKSPSFRSVPSPTCAIRTRDSFPRIEKRMRHDRPGAWLKSYAYLKNSNDCPHLSRAYEYQFYGLRSHSLDDSLPVT